MVAELNSGGTVQALYRYGINLISSTVSGTTKYYIYNAHGDVVQLANSTGAVVKTYHYDAFGNEVSPDAADTNPFRYCGQYFDKETGTYYLRARYYDPAIGRFISQDNVAAKRTNLFNQYGTYQNLTLNGGVYRNAGKGQYIIDDPLSLNLYTYCSNNPVQYVDSNGHWVTVAVVGIALVCLAVLMVYTVSPSGREVINKGFSALYTGAKSTVEALNGLSGMLTLAMLKEYIKGEKTQHLVDVEKEIPGDNQYVYQLAYIDTKTNELKTIGVMMNYSTAVKSLLSEAYIRQKTKQYGRFWGVYTENQSYAKALAVFFGATLDPEVHNSGYYGHYHDFNHKYHIFFGAPIIYPN